MRGLWAKTGPWWGQGSDAYHIVVMPPSVSWLCIYDVFATTRITCTTLRHYALILNIVLLRTYFPLSQGGFD